MDLIEETEQTEREQPKPEQKPAQSAQPDNAEEEQVVVPKDALYKLAYRIVAARGVMMSPNEAKALVEKAVAPWEEIKAYVAANPH